MPPIQDLRRPFFSVAIRLSFRILACEIHWSGGINFSDYDQEGYSFTTSLLLHMKFYFAL